ncbi:P-type conjugative transfer protein TrbL [Luteibacter sp. W1I16]|uniref:P-type conjugative transfer protein TrbL n=1 Tax=Luteibacter sp. W1I16 TaxID=3373922 RepID=UPI003D248D0D
MHSFTAGQRALVAVLSIMAVPAAFADPIAVRDVAGEVMKQFTDYPLNENILEAAKTLFTSLATISLVWTMGMLIVRQDIGEMLMELLRFIVVTGTFYWLLVNASSHDGGDGFVDDIVHSFFNMVNDSTSDELVRNKANSILARGLNVFYKAVEETSGGDDGDRLLAGGIALAVLVVCAIMAAQFLLALVMAWVLGYAGIFLLGFGGARWTSSIAINFYKHVVAIGVALLALSIVGTVAAGFLDQLEFDPNRRGATDFPNLGLMLAGSIVMMVLSTKLPQLLYTLVTGSTLGMYAGSANAAGTAIASAGAAAMATAATRLPGGGSHGGFAAGHVESGRTESVMSAVQRSASVTSGMSDPFHVGTAADSFGMARSSNPYHQTTGGSVFTATQNLSTMGPAPASSPVAGWHGRAPASVDDVVRGGSAPAGEAAPGDMRGDSGESVSASGITAKIHGDVRGATGVTGLSTDRGMAQPDYLAELESIEAAALHPESARVTSMPTHIEDAQAIESLTEPDEREARNTDVGVSNVTRRVSGETGVAGSEHLSINEAVPTNLSKGQQGDVPESAVLSSRDETADGATAHEATANTPLSIPASQSEDHGTVERSLTGVAEPAGLPDEREVPDAGLKVSTDVQSVSGEIDVALGEHSSIDVTLLPSLPTEQPSDVADSAVQSTRSETADGVTLDGATASIQHAIPARSVNVTWVPTVDDEHASARQEEDRDRSPPRHGKQPLGKSIPPQPIDDASPELPE